MLSSNFWMKPLLRSSAITKTNSSSIRERLLIMKEKKSVPLNTFRAGWLSFTDELPKARSK